MSVADVFRLNRLARAAACPQLSDWHSRPADEDAEPVRARGSLTPAELRAAERYALRYGVNLPHPADGNARQSALALIWLDMMNMNGVGPPSVAGDPRVPDA